MAEARSRDRWAHTSAVMCLLANVHRDPKKTRPFTPADFDPHSRRLNDHRAKANISILKQVFVSQSGGTNA